MDGEDEHLEVTVQVHGEVVGYLHAFVGVKLYCHLQFVAIWPIGESFQKKVWTQHLCRMLMQMGI
ncbi:hypothetical protein Syun_021254 [Stephania yunnanensis]|uniref:Uncharacterized protein n=1 Tax=Stephania yunnanensis TaxID=152371 RepID=A0AAP0NNZ3_9MAGN